VGIFTDSLENKAFARAVGTGAFSSHWKKSFFQTAISLWALEKQAWNKGISSKYQALEDGEDGPSRSPEGDPGRRNSIRSERRGPGRGLPSSGLKWIFLEQNKNNVKRNVVLRLPIPSPPGATIASASRDQAVR